MQPPTGGASQDLARSKLQRFSEPQKFLPIVFVSLVISFLFTSYTSLHILPLLQVGAREREVDHQMRARGIMEGCLFLFLTAMMLICYVRSILTQPGLIPDGDPQWEYQAEDGRPGPHWVPAGLQEVKKNGQRRHCKWCGKYKPDRCHHCRVCKTCILKMDHHCPWLYNCVGFGNYKFFFLLLLYAVLDAQLVLWTMVESVQRCIVFQEETPFAVMFVVFFTETLAFFLSVLITIFFTFHIWLSVSGMTTVEFCEKSQSKKEGETPSQEASIHDMGFCGNIRAVLGEVPLLWFFPCSRPTGDGTNFMSEETRLCRDVQTDKSVRSRTHQRTQRPGRYGDPRGYGGGYYDIGYGGY